MKIIRYFILILFLSFFGKNTFAQLIVPEFEEPKKIEVLVSDAEESMPLPFSNSDQLYFVRTYIEGSMRQRKKGQEILLTSKESSNWTKPKADKGLDNDEGNNAIIGISNDGMRVYFFNSIQSHKKLAVGLSYRDRYETGEWSDFKPIKIPNFEVGQGIYSFYFNSDENILLASIIQGIDLEANSDLYVSLKQDDKTWSEFKNLGSVVNTSGNEITPFIDEDGKTLYFSSTGHKGLGGADIFMSQRLDETWTNWSSPVNLGSKINSENFDAYFLKTKNNEAFFASNRGEKYSDIYLSAIKEETKSETKKLLAQFYYKGDPKPGILLELFDNNGVLLATEISDEEGKFCCIPEELKNFKLKMNPIDEAIYSEAKVYLLHEEGAMSDRLFPIGTGVFSDVNQVLVETITKPVEEVKGRVKLKDGATSGVKVNIYDEGGNFIKQVETDEHGDFSYSKLAADNNFIIEVDESAGLMDAEILILNPQTEEMTPINQSGLKRSARLAKPKNIEQVQGNVKLKDGVKSGVKLNLYDEGGNFITQVETDENGDFTYTKLSSDDNYIIRIEGEEDADVMMLDPATKKLTALKKSSVDGYYSPDKKELIVVEQFGGIYTVNDIPLPEQVLLIKDENGFPIDTTRTNTKGEFDFSKPVIDRVFTIQTQEEQFSKGQDIALVKGKGFKYKKEKLSGNIFRYSEATLPDLGPKITEKEAWDKELSMKTPPSKKPEPVKTKAKEEILTNGERPNELIPFEFNTYYMRPSQRVQLNAVAWKMRKNANLQIELIGHTDTSGTDLVNEDVSLKRAEIVKKYLVSMGVDADRISAKGVKDTQPIASNSTREGRIKNRRVELFFRK